VALLERDTVLEELDRRVEAARQGRGAFIAISGEAGIGKSAVVEAFHERHDRLRFLVGRCDSLSTPRPLGPLFEMARDRFSGLADLVSDDRPRHEIFDAVLDELRSRLRPTVVVIEDAHWADEATLDLIRFVGRRIDGVQGVVVVTYRDDEVGPSHPLRVAMGDMATVRGLTHISLQPLSVDAVSALAEDSGADPVQVHRVTGGNPFFVTELLASGGTSVPRTVADAVLARASRLSAAPRRLVDAVSIVPDRAPEWLVEHLVGADAGARAEAIEGGLLVAFEEGVRFRHDLARRAIEDALDPSRVVDLHKRAIEALESPPHGVPDAAQLAHHAERVGDEERLLRWGAEAAEQALAQGSYAEAYSHDERLLRAGSLVGPDRARVLERLESTARELSRFDVAEATLEEALTIWRAEGDRLGEAHALARLALVRWTLGRGPEAMAMVEEAVGLVGHAAREPKAGWVHAMAAALAMLHRDIGLAVSVGRVAIEIGEEAGDQALVARALNAVGAAKIVGGLEGGTADLLRSAAIAEALRSPAQRGAALSNLGSGLGEVRRYDEAVAFLEETIETSERYDLDFMVEYATAWLARIHFEQGRWGVASLLAQRSIRKRRSPAIVRIVAGTVLGRVAVRRGEPGAAALLDEPRRLADATGDLQRTWPVAAGLAELAWLQGRSERIAAIVGDLYEEAVSRGVPWATGELALWLWRAGELSEPPAGCPEPVTLQITGDWAAAAAAWEALGCPYEAADALADGDDAAALRALETFDDLGALPAGRRLRRLLSSRGVRVPRGPRPATRDNTAGLTPRQMDVIGLLAEGMSNADIAAELYISEKTAAHHVSAILGRLQVSSRGEAVAAAHRLGLLGADQGPGGGRG
jgi:DNA-binding CsgD family transcriptional regulator/tetratricopeptide (TPR) repeat protein